MRIIVIILVTATSGFGAAYLAVGAVFLLMFSTSGDRVENTINTVTQRTLCYPTMAVYLEISNLGKRMDRERTPYSQNRVDKVLKSHDVIWVNEGADVKIHKSTAHYEGQLKAILYNVDLIDEPSRTCLIHGQYLEMRFIC
jgi:hypothetical protein